MMNVKKVSDALTENCSYDYEVLCVSRMIELVKDKKMTSLKHTLEMAAMLDVEGGAIHYRYYVPHDEEAAARTPLVVVHGGPGGCHAVLYEMMQPIVDQRPVVFYDQLGSYFSPADITPELMNVGRFTRELSSLVNALELEKIDLIGHSWGGVVVLNYSLEHTDRVSNLIFSSPLISTPAWIEDCNALIEKLPDDLKETIKRCEADGTTDGDDYKAADGFFSDRHFCRTKNPPYSVERNGKRLSWDVYNTMWGPSEFTCTGVLKDLDLSPGLGELTMPTLFLCGEYDMATPARMYEFQQQVEGAKCVVLADSGHATYVDNHDGFLGAVSDFLSTKPPMKNSLNLDCTKSNLS